MGPIDGHDRGKIANHSRLRDHNIQHPVINFHLEQGGIKPLDKLSPVDAGGKVSDEVVARQLSCGEESEFASDLERRLS